MLKKIIGSLLRCSLVLVVRILRLMHGRRLKEVLMTAPASAGSFGDEAIFQGIESAYLRPNQLMPRQILLKGFSPIAMRIEQLAPLTVFDESIGSDLSFIWSLRKARSFIVPGADVIDGVYSAQQARSYLYLLNLANQAGVPSRVLGFSFSTSPAPDVVSDFKKLSRQILCCVRDADSKKRFDQACGAASIQVADCGFLMEPAIDSMEGREIGAWIDSAKAGGNLILALNANAQTAVGQSKQICAAYAALIQDISVKGKIRVLLLPHDNRGEHSDYRMNDAIFKLLPENLKEQVKVVEHPIFGWEARALVSKCDLLVSGRMHLIVAALGERVPCIGIDYNAKFSGLMSFFDLADRVVDAREAYADGVLSREVTRVLSELDVMAERINQHHTAVMSLARRNFDHL